MKVVHCKKEPFDVYIGRPSKWGNPFSHLKNKGDILVSSREEAIDAYDKMLSEGLRQDLVGALHEIAGKTLGCWCSPKPCHGDVLIRLCIEMGLYE